MKMFCRIFPREDRPVCFTRRGLAQMEGLPRLTGPWTVTSWLRKRRVAFTKNGMTHIILTSSVVISGWEKNDWGESQYPPQAPLRLTRGALGTPALFSPAWP